MGAHAAGQSRPADQAEDDRDEEKAPFGRPFRGDEGGERHEERDGGHGAHRVGQHLQSAVDPPAGVAGDAADDEGEDEADQHPDGADGQRGPYRVEGAGEDVLPRAVGAENVDAAAVDAEEMAVEAGAVQADVEPGAGEVDVEVEDLVVPALDEELDVAPLLHVDRGDPAEIGFDRTGAFQSVEEGAERAAVMVAEMRNLRGAVLVLLVAPGDGGVVGGEEGGGDAHGDQQEQHDAGDHGATLAAEAGPDQLALARGEIGLFGAPVARRGCSGRHVSRPSHFCGCAGRSKRAAGR